MRDFRATERQVGLGNLSGSLKKGYCGEIVENDGCL